MERLLSYFDAIIIGTLQGLTEFLPISSSGHLVIVQFLLNINVSGNLIEVAAHIGTLFSVLIVYRSEIIHIISTLRSKKTQKYFAILLLATLPSILFVLYFKSFILAIFESQKHVALALVFTGLFLFLTFLSNKIHSPLDAKKAILIGIAQALAIIPGVSRSGMTITTALILGIPKKDAAQFSFLLAIPAILGATIITFLDLDPVIRESMTPQLITIVLISFLSGYLALRLLIKLLERGKLYYFGFYCIIMGVISFSML